MSAMSSPEAASMTTLPPTSDRRAKSTRRTSGSRTRRSTATKATADSTAPISGSQASGASIRLSPRSRTASPRLR
ncbi:hypothetical protein [Streptomyces maremycinicus]|uniref:hypothetical protein n=1 Tax=Streptomyces maremycinicus TaxID=1679753 RepID=UPI001331B77C|nr:hypothetical protein [Streptomyces sp. NBRC 110468]